MLFRKKTVTKTYDKERKLTYCWHSYCEVQTRDDFRDIINNHQLLWILKNKGGNMKKNIIYTITGICIILAATTLVTSKNTTDKANAAC